MKRFFQKIFLILILFTLGNYAYLVIVKKYDWNFSKHLEANGFQNKQFDLIAIGNSLVMDGIDTKLLSTNGISSYNLAIGGVNLNTIYIQLSNYLKANRKPKYVLLGLSSCLNEKIFEEGEIHPIVDFT